MRQPSCASAKLLGSGGSPSFPETVSLPETPGQAIMSNHSAGRMRMGKTDPIFICIIPHGVQSSVAALPSQIPMRKEGHLLHACWMPPIRWDVCVHLPQVSSITAFRQGLVS